jgi:hypothetical protein
MTITTLRPSSDVKKTGVSYSSGTTAWSLVDDSPDDDATYIRAAAGLQFPKAYAHLGLTNLGAVSGSQRIKATQIRGRVRMHTSDPGHGATLAVRLWDPQSGLGYPPAGYEDQPAGVPDGFTTSNSSTFQAKTGAWHTAPPKLDGSEWTKTIIDRCVLHLAWYYSVGSVHENLRASELYVDVDIRDQGVVSGVTVSGNDASTRPTVAWSFTANADGDEQIAYQVRVFSSAQYGATGFDPTISPASWSSGTRQGGGEAIAVERDLLLGVTYKAYVRGAADFNGARWWSAWALSSTFTITPTPPAVPTLTVTADTTVPWLRNICKVTSNTNLLSYDDASFEGGLGSWANLTNATVAQSATVAAHGTQSMRLTAIAVATMEAATPIGSYRVKPGLTYTALAEFRSAVTVHNCRVNLRWYDKNGTIIGAVVNGTGANDTTSGWTQRTLTAAAPATAYSARVGVEVTNPSAIGEQHYVDKASLALGSGTTWGVGGMVQALAAVDPLGGCLVEYSHNAVGAGNLAPAQLATGGDATETPDGWVTSGTFSTVAYDRADRMAGAGSIRWDVRDTAAKLYLGWVWGASAGEDPDPTYVLPAVPGRTYTLSVAARASVAFSSQLNLQAIDRNGNTISSGGGAGAAFVKQTSGSAAASTSTSPTVTSTGGNLLVAFITRSGGLATGIITSVTDSAGNTWLLATRGAVSGVNNTRIECWYAQNAAAVTGLTYNSSSSQSWAWDVLEFSGMVTSGVLDVASPDNSAVPSSTTIATPALPTTNATDVVLAAIHHTQTTSVLQTPAWTAATNFDDAAAGSGRAAYRIVSSTGTYNADWLLGTAQAAGVITVAFKANASVTPSPITIDTSWARFTATQTIPDGACWMRVVLDNTASVTERMVWADEVTWNVGATPTVDRQPSGQPTVWTPLRGADEGELAPDPSDGIAWVHDLEVHPGFHTLYRARNITTVADLQVASAPSAYVATSLTPPATWVLKVAGSPTLACEILVPPDGLTEEQHEESTTFYPVRPAVAQGFGQRPVVVSDFVGGHDGTLKLEVLDEDDWLVLRQIIGTAAPLLLVFPDFGARYIRVVDRGWPRTSYAGTTTLTLTGRRTVSLGFIECDRPI